MAILFGLRGFQVSGFNRVLFLDACPNFVVVWILGGFLLSCFSVEVSSFIRYFWYSFSSFAGLVLLVLAVLNNICIFKKTKKKSC